MVAQKEQNRGEKQTLQKFKLDFFGGRHAGGKSGKEVDVTILAISTSKLN
jgi:hypothetical protein